MLLRRFERFCSRALMLSLLFTSYLWSGSFIRPLPFSLAAETARVLPKGIFRARVVTIQTFDIDETINEDGELEPMGNRLNRSVTVDDLIMKDARVGRLVDTLNTLQPGLGDELMAANLSNPVTMSVTTIIPALEYGITNDLSVGIRVPVVRRQLDASLNSDTVDNSAFAAASVGGLSAQLSAALAQFGAQGFDSRMFARQIFTERGYKAPESFDTTEIGDIEMGVKYNFFHNREVYLTGQWGVRAPTGSEASLENIYDQGSGNGAWATAGSLFQEYSPIRRVRLGASQKLTYYFPDTRERAVPLHEQDGLPSLRPEDGQVQDVTRSQGLKFEGELSSTVYFFGDALSFWGAYQYMTKAEDEFDGHTPSGVNLYYDGLSDNTYQMSHALEIGTGYSTVSAYRRKQFAIPGEIQLLYNKVVEGQNVPNLEYVRFDIMAYF